jgi:molybdenum cofactor guanylyltransferase
MKIEAFILIGGKSSRLGTDKAFVEIAGQTLAARAVGMVEKGLLPARITFVAASETQFKTQLLAGLGHPLVSDLKPGFGAWSGLSTALAHAKSEWILALACDLPLVSVELLQLLAGFADRDVDAVVPRQPDGQLQPLCAIYRVKTAHSVTEAMFTDAARPPLRAIFGELRTRIVKPDEYRDLPNAGKLFLNVNTEADLALAHHVHRTSV